MHNRRTILMTAATLVTGAAAFLSTSASASTDLAAYVNQVPDEAITSLGKAGPTDPARAAALKPILLKNFDMPGMARHVLGAYWKKISPEQQEAFIGQFTNYIASVYGQRFKAYKGQKLEVKRVRDQGAMATVFTAVAEGSEDAGARVDWEIKNDGTEPLIADIRVEGLSLSDTHRHEFTTVLSQHNGDITALMGILKNKSLVN
jgi:phospholipid transport system substrate-binding protein